MENKIIDGGRSDSVSRRDRGGKTGRLRGKFDEISHETLQIQVKPSYIE